MVYPNRVVLNINQKYVMPIPYTQQGDTARVLTFSILDKGVPFNLTGKTVRAKIVKPDNTKCYNDLTITNATGGECDLKLTNQVLAVAGKVNCQLEIKEGEELLSTIIFPIDVEPSIDINGAVESTNEFTALLNGIIKLDEWDKYFKETSGKIEEKYTERLNGINSSLEETAKDSSVKSDGKMKKCMVSFTDDDCRKEIWSILKPIADEKGVKFTLAMPTSKIGMPNYITEEQAKSFYNEGWEFMWHTHTENNLDTMSLEQMENEYNESVKIWSKLGLPKNKIVAYPQGHDNHLVRTFCSGKFKAGVDTFRTNNNIVPYSQFALSRYEIGAPLNEAIKNKLGCPYDNNTLDYYKWLVDRAFQDNAWLIFYTHAWYPTFDSTQQQYLKDVIDYIRSKNIDIVTLEEGLELTGNLINIGDDNGNEYNKDTDGYYFTVGCDGSIRSSSLKDMLPQLNYSEGIDYNSKSINDFLVGITITAVNSADATNMPLAKAGTLITFKPNQYSGYSIQKYYIYETGEEFTRGCNKSGAWQPWESKTLFVGSANTNPINKPITEYQVGVTVNFVGSTICTGFPNDKPGTLTTIKPTALSNAYSYQEYVIYNEGIKYFRYCNIGGAWQPWKKYSFI